MSTLILLYFNVINAIYFCNKWNMLLYLLITKNSGEAILKIVSFNIISTSYKNHSFIFFLILDWS